MEAIVTDEAISSDRIIEKQSEGGNKLMLVTDMNGQFSACKESVSQAGELITHSQNGNHHHELDDVCGTTFMITEDHVLTSIHPDEKKSQYQQDSHSAESSQSAVDKNKDMLPHIGNQQDENTGKDRQYQYSSSPTKSACQVPDEDQHLLSHNQQDKEGSQQKHCGFPDKSVSQEGVNEGLLSTRNQGKFQRHLCLCSACGKSYTYANDLENHLFTHDPKELTAHPFICTICGQSSEKVDDLEKHLSTHRVVKTITRTRVPEKSKVHDLEKKQSTNNEDKKNGKECPICGTIIRACNMKKHMLMHTRVKDQTCTVCGKYIKRGDNIKRHMSTHARAKNIKCIVCGKSFTQKSDLKEHCLTHRVKPHKPLVPVNQDESQQKPCTIPGQPLFQSRNIEEHFLTNDQEKGQHKQSMCAICVVCGKSFIKACDLSRHLLRHNSEKHPPLPCKCGVCDQSFANVVDLEQHFLTHNRETSQLVHQCTACDKSFNQADDLKEHLLTHNKTCQESDEKKNEKRQLVIPPAKSLSQARNIEEHVLKPNEEKGRIRKCMCSICGKAFTKSVDLEKHFLTHESVELTPYPCTCTVCGQSFTKVGDLEEHLLKHTKVRRHSPCMCIICGKSFIKADGLEKHMLTHTSKELLPHSCICSICGQLFTKAGDLENHVLTHIKAIKEQGQKCPICGKSVGGGSYDLKKHIVTHSGKNHHCTVCGRSFTLKQSLGVHMMIHKGATI